MEEFFNQPILDKIYNSLNNDFDRYLLPDRNEAEQYNTILEKQQKLYKIIKEMIGNKKEKVEQFTSIMTQLELCNREINDYWNKKYFKLGFTYMIDICMPKDFARLERESYSQKVHNFLNSVKIKHLNEQQKKLITDFIKNLNKGTETQKKRFFMYYNLIPNTNQILTYTDIGKIENCSISAIKTSIINIVSQLINLTGSKKCLFLSIIKEINI